MKTCKQINMLLCQTRFLMQPSNENAVYNILYYLHNRETHYMSNCKPYVVLKYCAQSLAYKPLSI